GEDSHPWWLTASCIRVLRDRGVMERKIARNGCPSKSRESPVSIHVVPPGEVSVDLNGIGIGITHVKSRFHVLGRSDAPGLQVPGDRFPIKTLYADRKVVHHPWW